MDVSRIGLQKLFSGEFGGKWKDAFDDNKTQVNHGDLLVHNGVPGSVCTAREIGNGYLNKVYRLQSSDGSSSISWSVVVKHAPPYIKFLNIEQPLGTQRIYFEYLALKMFDQVLPGSVPAVYFHHEDTKCVVMEDLKTFDVMSLHLESGHLSMHAVTHLAEIVAKLHRKTHVETVTSEELHRMENMFRNDEMVALNSEFTFVGLVDPNNQTNNCSSKLVDIARSIREDQIILDRVAELNNIFLEKKECLTHGDLHLGSVMVDGDIPKLIDAEFAFIGPAGADIGILLANFIFYYVAYMIYPPQENPTMCNLVKEAIKIIVEVYFNEAKEYLSDAAVEVLISQTAGFTGCHIVKWVIGVGKAEILTDKPQAELMCVQCGVRLLREYHDITSKEDLLQYILDSAMPSLRT